MLWNDIELTDFGSSHAVNHNNPEIQVICFCDSLTARPEVLFVQYESPTEVNFFLALRALWHLSLFCCSVRLQCICFLELLYNVSARMEYLDIDMTLWPHPSISIWQQF